MKSYIITEIEEIEPAIEWSLADARIVHVEVPSFADALEYLTKHYDDCYSCKEDVWGNGWQLWLTESQN